MNTSRDSGQVGLVVLLVGAVLMTIGLGVASQSVMEINTAGEEVSSTQAFNAAEQGIEKVFVGETYESKSFSVDNYNVVADVDEITDTYQGTVLVGHSAQLFMTNVDDMQLTWMDGGCGTNYSAVVVTFIDAAYGIRREAWGRDCEKNDGFHFIRPRKPYRKAIFPPKRNQNFVVKEGGNSHFF